MIRKAGKLCIGSERGQGLVEYGLILGVIVIAVLIVISTGISVTIRDLYQSNAAQVNDVLP
jgi:Flp pilus assembly pilin Flp